MPSALATAKAQAVAASVAVFHAAHAEGRQGPRMLRIAERLEDILEDLDLELAEDARPSLPPDEEGVSLCQPG